MDFTIDSVETYWPNPYTECWAVNMTRPDGGSHTYVFPKFSLAQRAAEYGFDPGDIETLLDVVLHEQFIHMPWNPVEDPAAQQGMVTPAVESSSAARKGDMVPVDLFNAPTIALARDAYLARVDHAKKNRGRVRSPGKGPDPLDVIRAGHGITADEVAGRARVVDLERRALRGQLTADEMQELRRSAKGDHRA